MDSFQQIDECVYSNKQLGASKQLETMGCECLPEEACTEEAGCVNRLTSIECYGATACRDGCANRRFQNKEFAPLEVFDAGKKGYGVRTTAPLGENQFVYEYIGEVIDKARFERRKVTYEREGIQHFYFMMLQKDEFIDATKKGSVARFLNHSCNPNCAIHKWVVGPKLRMGIFTLRPISPGEELTFDYNADRFGDTVQECLCGEPNCRGILNGKKDAVDLIPRALWQILGLDPLLADSLREQLKSDKAMKKKKELDAEILALIPNQPLPDQETANQVVSFLMQPQEEFLVAKVLDRIYSTESQAIQAQILKMHGYELFGTLLSQYTANNEMVLEMLKVLEAWPRVTRNKISSSKIEGVVQALVETKTGAVVEQARALIAAWSELEMAYRIPRRERAASERAASEASEAGEPGASAPSPPSTSAATAATAATAASAAPAASTPSTPKLPPGWASAYKDKHIYYYNRELNLTQWEFPAPALARKRAQERRERERAKQLKESQDAELQRIIEAAADTSTTATTPTPLERKLTHTLAAYVPKIVFKYKDRLDHDRCKKHAREIVKILVDKEIRKGVQEIDLTDAKKKKIKGFVSEYLKKLLERKSLPTPKKIKTA